VESSLTTHLLSEELEQQRGSRQQHELYLSSFTVLGFHWPRYQTKVVLPWNCSVIAIILIYGSIDVLS